MDAMNRIWVVLGLVVAGCAPDGETGGGVEVRAAADGLDAPLDAVPDAAGRTIYFLTHKAGGLALLKVEDGAPVEIAAGLGMAARSLALAGDGSALAVADGGLERVATADGARSRLAEAEDFDVRGVDVVRYGGVDTIYFTGVDPMDGEVGVFRAPLAGGAVEVVSKGFGDADLDGRPGRRAAHLFHRGHENGDPARCDTFAAAPL